MSCCVRPAGLVGTAATRESLSLNHSIRVHPERAAARRWANQTALDPVTEISGVNTFLKVAAAHPLALKPHLSRFLSCRALARRKGIDFRKSCDMPLALPLR